MFQDLNMQLDVSDPKHFPSSSNRLASGKDGTSSNVNKRKDTYIELESPMIDFGKFASIFYFKLIEIKKERTMMTPDSTPVGLRKKKEGTPSTEKNENNNLQVINEINSLSPERKSNQVHSKPATNLNVSNNRSSLNKIGNNDHQDDNAGFESHHNYKKSDEINNQDDKIGKNILTMDSQYAVGAILEQISKQKDAISKNEDVAGTRSPADNGNSPFIKGKIDITESIDQGIKFASKRPSSKFNYEEFKNFADRKASHSPKQGSSRSSEMPMPKLMKITSDYMENSSKPRTFMQIKSLDIRSDETPKQTGVMEESEILVKANDKGGINFTKNGDPIIVRSIEKDIEKIRIKANSVSKSSHLTSAQQFKNSTEIDYQKKQNEEEKRKTSVDSHLVHNSEKIPWPTINSGDDRNTNAIKEEPKEDQISSNNYEKDEFIFPIGDKKSRVIISSESRGMEGENQEEFDVNSF